MIKFHSFYSSTNKTEYFSSNCLYLDIFLSFNGHITDKPV